MDVRNPYRAYVKGRFGVDQNLTLTLSLAAFVFAYIFGTLNDSQMLQRLSELKQLSPELSVEKIDRLTELSNRHNVNFVIEGEYAYLINYGKKATLRGDIKIDKTAITRTINVKNHTMYAEANYELVGSTIQYSNVVGDKYLFSEYGSVIGKDAQQGAYIEIESGLRLYVDAQISEDQYEIYIVKDERDLIQRLRETTKWTFLQAISACIGIAILFHVFIRLFIDRKKNRITAHRFKA